MRNIKVGPLLVLISLVGLLMYGPDVSEYLRQGSMNIGQAIEVSEEFSVPYFLDLSSMFDATSKRISERAGVGDLLKDTKLVINGIPFEVAIDGDNLVRASRGGRGNVEIEVRKKAGAIGFLLVGTDALSALDHFKGGKDINDVCIEIHYEDGLVDRSFPFNVGRQEYYVGSELSAYLVYPNEDRIIERIVVYDNIINGIVHIAAITLDEDIGRHRQLRMNLISSSSESELEEIPLTVDLRANVLTISNTYYRYSFEVGRQFRVTEMLNRIIGEDLIARDNSNKLFSLECMGASGNESVRIGESEFAVETTNINSLGQETIVSMLMSPRTKAIPIELVVTITASEAPFLSVSMEVNNKTSNDIFIKPVFPDTSGVKVGDNVEDNNYFHPRRGGLISNKQISIPADIWNLYGQNITIPLIDLFNPVLGGGTYFMVKDTGGNAKYFALNKYNTFTIGVHHLPRVIPSNDSLDLGSVEIGMHFGTWHQAFSRYKEWLATWYKPIRDADWIRDIYNFRQIASIWAKDLIYDQETGRYSIDELIKCGEENVGGFDYIHWLDWYSNLGEYTYPEEFGGIESLREVIKTAHSHGIKVGLYIEGTLLAKDTGLGREYGAKWQMLDKNGHSYEPWPGNYVPCPAVEEWQDHIAQVAARLVGDLDLDGIYLDEIGYHINFLCYNPVHAHAGPAVALQGQAAIMQKVKEAVNAVKPGVAVYHESPSSDYMSQYVDATFSYYLNSEEANLAPKQEPMIDLYRFAFPGVKVFSINDWGKDLPGIKRAFFNGEGMWYQMTLPEEHRTFVTKATGIMSENADAFRSMIPEPLVATNRNEVHANKFPTDGKTVYTLYNSGNTTARGSLLTLDYSPSKRYVDLWNNTLLTLEDMQDGNAQAILEIHPKDVGAIGIFDKVIAVHVCDSGEFSIEYSAMETLDLVINVEGSDRAFAYVLTNSPETSRVLNVSFSELGLDDKKGSIIKFRVFSDGILKDMDFISSH